MPPSMTARRTRLERLETWLKRTWLIRRFVFYGSLAFPSFVTLLLVFLVLYPMLFAPAQKLATTLTAMVAGGLSFASVALSVSKSRLHDESWGLRMAMSGLALFRFALAMTIVLALNAVRERAVEALGGGHPVELALRGAMVLVTAVAIVIAFLGFQSMVVLLGPDHEEQAVASLGAAVRAGEKPP